MSFLLNGLGSGIRLLAKLCWFVLFPLVVVLAVINIDLGLPDAMKGQWGQWQLVLLLAALLHLAYLAMLSLKQGVADKLAAELNSHVHGLTAKGEHRYAPQRCPLSSVLAVVMNASIEAEEFLVFFVNFYAAYLRNRASEIRQMLFLVPASFMMLGLSALRYGDAMSMVQILAAGLLLSSALLIWGRSFFLTLVFRRLDAKAPWHKGKMSLDYVDLMLRQQAATAR